MRTSQFLIITYKETPAEAEIISHKLMLRSGMLRKNAAGIYTWLPLGLKVLQKVADIVRDEMNQSGALELLMPAIQSADLWHESGRWEQYGPELLRIKDRHKRDFCFGPTHEEVITDLMRHELRSYKQLPITVYQIQTKFRDEIRPRFGVMRAREFLMKDAYSFNIDADSLNKTYAIMHDTYNRIFTRLGLKFRSVLADTGNIGGALSHEFHVIAESGEDQIAYSDQSDYAANVEKAESLAPKATRPAPGKPMEVVDTPKQYTIAAVSEFLKLPPQQMAKTLLVKGAEVPVVALILRGDHELNHIKAEKLPQVAAPLEFATDAEIVATIGCKPGSIGLVNLAIPCIVDRDAAVLSDFVCGANKDDQHMINVNWERDIQLPEIADLRRIVAGDLSPDGKGKLQIARGIEVGHIFQLGDKYSKAMNATVLNSNGKATVLQMGCYGIGVSRIVAAAIEQNHDERGIIWPKPIAPFQVALIPINMHKSEQVCEVTEKLYQDLQAHGIEVLLDDRNERVGVIFADMDLLGIPAQIVIGERGLKNGTVEYKDRKTGTTENVKLDDVVAFMQQ